MARLSLPPVHTLGLLALAVLASGCDLPFDNSDIGSYSATVRGAETRDLRGQGFYSRISDEPSTWSIYLTGVNAPVVLFEIPTDAVRPGTYAVPADVRATFEIDRLDGSVYVGTGGALTVTAATAARVEGTFAFTASGPGGEVSVEGRFVAE